MGFPIQTHIPTPKHADKATEASTVRTFSSGICDIISIVQRQVPLVTDVTGKLTRYESALCCLESTNVSLNHVKNQA